MEPVGDATMKYVKIYGQNILNNVKKIRQHVGTPIMAVVKSDAYGHNLRIAAPILQDSEIDCFGVSTVDEGISLREMGIEIPVILLADPVNRFEDIFKYDITPTLSYLEDVKKFEEFLSAKQQYKDVFIAIDTGMGRYGFHKGQIHDLIRYAKTTKWLRFRGLSTHLSSAGDIKFTRNQLNLFNKCISEFKQNGIEFPIITAANTLAAMDLPESRFNLVRIGNAIYGEKVFKADVELDKTWDFMVRIIRIRHIPAGSYVGYGHTFRAKRDMKLGILNLGYYDGFTLVRKKDPQIFINFVKAVYHAIRDFFKPIYYIYYKDKPIKVVGQVSMQMTCIDLTDTDAKQGEYVKVKVNPIYIKDNIPRCL